MATVSLQNDKFLVVAVFLFQATVCGEIGDVIAGKLSVPEGKTKIFKSLGELETTSTTVHLPNDVWNWAVDSNNYDNYNKNYYHYHNNNNINSNNNIIIPINNVGGVNDVSEGNDGNNYDVKQQQGYKLA